MKPFLITFSTIVVGILLGVSPILYDVAWSQPKPRLTDAQKLEIRNAQIDFFTAQANLQASPVYQQFQKAQQHLNETAQKVTKEAGVDPAKFSLGPDLEFTPVPQKEKKNAGESPAPPTLR